MSIIFTKLQKLINESYDHNNRMRITSMYSYIILYSFDFSIWNCFFEYTKCDLCPVLGKEILSDLQLALF